MVGWPDKAPRHPQTARRSLLAWPGYQSGLKVGQLDRRAVGAIAKPLAHTIHETRQVSEALEAGMGVMLPAQSWRNQLDPAHTKRAGAFASLAIDRPGQALDPEAGRFEPAFAERYAADHLQAELGARATIATTPAHVLESEGGVGRANDLLLARLCTEEFAARRAALPAPGRPAEETRELYATLIVQARHVTEPEILARLIGSYAALEGVSGYLVVAANCTQGGPQVAAYASLALQLQAATDRPVVTFGLGDAHLALLASGVAATCAGLHGMSFKFPPDELPEPEDGEGDEEKPGLGVYTYHPAILGNVGRLGPAGETARAAIFKNRPCRCGHHPAEEPPRGKPEIVRHNAYAVSRDAHYFGREADVAMAERKLLARAQNAERMRSFLKLSKLRRGFLSVAPEARRLRGEADATEEPGSPG